MLFDNDFGDGLVVFVDSYPGKATEPMLVQRVPQEGLTCDTVISGFDNARRKQFGLVLREVLLVLGYQFAWRLVPSKTLDKSDKPLVCPNVAAQLPGFVLNCCGHIATV